MYEIDKDGGLNEVEDQNYLAEKLIKTQALLNKMEKEGYEEKLESLYRSNEDYLRLVDDVDSGYDASNVQDEDDSVEDDYFQSERELEELKTKIIEECMDRDFVKLFNQHEQLERYVEDIEKRMNVLKYGV